MLLSIRISFNFIQIRSSRVALLFNKRLSAGCWQVEQVDNCMQVVQVNTCQGPVQLINIYVVAEGGQVTLREDSALQKILSLLADELESVLLGDFNLHHPSWRGNWVWRADEVAQELIDITTQWGRCLATSQGAVTWRGGWSSGTTIDLTFLTLGLYNSLVRCAPLDLPEEVEDHSAVETILGGRQAISPAWMHWSWKDMDVAQVEVDAWSLLVPRGIVTGSE